MESIAAEFQWVGGIAFAIAIAFLTARSYMSGKKETPTKVQEFAVTGQLADMSPIMELVEQAGLLVQQQVRTNINLEAVAKAMERAADAYTAHLASEEREREIEEEVERRVRERGK